MLGAQELVRRRAAQSLALLGLATALAGCISPRRATVRELHHRAVFDLGCPAESVRVQRTGARTQAVVGCGRRLVYVERCDPALPHDEACGWQLDTPSFAEIAWPQHQQAQRELEQQRRAAEPPRWPAQEPTGRAGSATELGPYGAPELGPYGGPYGGTERGTESGTESGTEGAAAATSPGDASAIAPAEKGKRRRAQRRDKGRSFAADLYDADADEPLDQSRDRRGVYDQR